MRIHVLKTWSPWFEMTRDGKKPWELRRNDRAYAEGDFLVLRLFTPVVSFAGDQNLCSTGPGGSWGQQYVVMKVMAVVSGMFVPSGWAVLTIADVTDQEFVEVMGRVTTDNEGGIWSGVGALGVR